MTYYKRITTILSTTLPHREYMLPAIHLLGALVRVDMVLCHVRWDPCCWMGSFGVRAPRRDVATRHISKLT